MNLSIDDDLRTLDENRIRYVVTRAALHAGKALTTPGLRPEQRLATLMDCHGDVLAARGPGDPLSFGEFRQAVKGNLGMLLPIGVEPLDLDGLLIVDQDGQVTEDAFDLDLEQRMLLHTLRKLGKTAGAVNSRELQSEIEQETAYVLLSKLGDQTVYVDGRSDLIRHPSGSVAALSELKLPPLVADFYHDIPYASVYKSWWYPCPICQWPMRLALRKDAGTMVGWVRCWHGPHSDMGAAYLFRPPADGSAPELRPEAPSAQPTKAEAVLHPNVTTIPDAVLAAGHKALARGIWRYTTVPGLPELALYDRLTERGINVHLWPGMDAYDLLVEAGPKRAKKKQLKVDVKDYTSAATLAQLIHAQEGDRGGAEWLVIPDYRAGQLPLLSGVCEKYGMRATTATEFGEMVCLMSGVSWA